MAENKKYLKKTEKYITERISKAGTHSLEICVRMNDQIYRKTISMDDFDTPKQALKFACKLRDEAIMKIRSGYTVSNFLTVEELYIKTFELFPVRMKTRERHDSFYFNGISEYGSRTIDRITSGDIQTSVNKYAAGHTRMQTGHFMAVWRRIYKTAVMMNISIPDRTIPVRIPECIEDTPRKKDISSEDLQIFCDVLLEYNAASISGHYMSQCVYYAIQIMRYCGLRPAETFALTRNDIHLNSPEGAYISINKASHSTVTSLLEIDRTKTKKSVRNVPIPDELKPILIDCLEWSRHELLFADYNGNLQDVDIISDYVRRVARKAKIQFNMYMLRHQLSTDLFSSGTPANVIRDIMGHESATMSLDYAVSNEKDRQTAVNSRRFS